MNARTEHAPTPHVKAKPATPDSAIATTTTTAIASAIPPALDSAVRILFAMG